MLLQSQLFLALWSVSLFVSQSFSDLLHAIMDNVLIYLNSFSITKHDLSCVQIVKNNASQPGFYICMKVMSCIFLMLFLAI